MFNFDEIVIDRVHRAHKFNFDGKRIWTASNIRDPQLECGGETVYSTDAVGANIMAFDRNKTGSFTFSNALMHVGVLADQLGSSKQVASDTNKLKFHCFEIIEVAVDSGTATATLTHTPYEAVPGVPFKYIDKVDNANVTQASYELGSTGASNFSVTDKIITLPTSGNWANGDRVAVKYTYETTSGIAIDDNAENFSEHGEFVIEAFCYNPCEKSNKKLLNIIFPNAKEDANVSLTLTNELTHPVTINAMQDYCSANKLLFRIEASEE